MLLQSSCQRFLGAFGPARSRSERYYRFQELAVSEIDPDGTNFPMFLNSLNKIQIEGFSEWVRRLFGYGVGISRKEGHLTINVVYPHHQMNIVDTGYGISQVLPVLGQIWWTVFGSPRVGSGRGSIIAIEQPELHLHPAHQALLADAIVGIFAEPSLRRTADFVIETHSEALINRLGALVQDQKISSDKLSVVLFDDDEADSKPTTTRIAKFNSDGTLVNWPFEFFVPSIR